MRSKTNQAQYVVPDLAIDQKQVGFQMTFSVADPVARKIVVTTPQWQRFIMCQQPYR